jgi:GGDEF domain-containing protein
LPVIFADVTRIENVMINLIGNAVKFTPENGTITIEAYPIEEMPEKLPGDVRGFVKISVRDTGIGIPNDLVEHIFEKFYQVSPTLAGDKEAGTGLGLSISKKIILAHGGDLTCKTKEHEGSTFSFTLPIIDMERRLYSCLEDHITKAIETNTPLAILFIRIEGFPDLVESYGRKECARGLGMVKKRIIEMGMKTSDEIFLAPWNGEIIMSMPGTDRHGAGVVRKKIREYISKKGISIGSPPTALSLVSGIASFPEQGTSPEELAGLGRKRLKDF